MKDGVPSGFPVLFDRHPQNPILTAADWPYAIHTAFNPAAARLEDGTTLLLCRCEDRRGFSHLCAARSKDGVTGWEIDPEPTFLPDPDENPEEHYGIEDPRIVWVNELQQYVVTYTSFSHSGPCVSIALTRDFKSFERLGAVLPPDDKDAAVLPRRFGDTFRLIHRPITDDGAHIWMSSSPDLRNWGSPQMMLPARRGGWWDAGKVGLSPPLIETSEGWLMIYHGVRRTGAGVLYRWGLALYDLEEPTRLLKRGDEWVFGPEAMYEQIGDVPGATFPGGWTLDPDGDGLNVYYGAADSSIGLARGRVSALLAWLEERGS